MGEKSILVDRPVLTLNEFDEQFGYIQKEEKTLREKMKETCAGTSCKGVLRCVAKETYRHIPLLETLRTYRWRDWIMHDLIAGISVGMIHIPQAMGFALLASVAPVYGLYATFWQVMIYMFFGQCRHLSMGTMAVISLMISTVVDRETALWKSQQLWSAPAGNSTFVGNTTTQGASLEALIANPMPVPVVEELTDEDRYRSSVANGVSLIVGATMFGMGVLRIGSLTTFMPPCFVSGFTTAASFHIVCTQLKPLFNVQVTRYAGMFNFPRSLWEILRALRTTNMADFSCSLICLAFLIFIKEYINPKYRHKLKLPIPADMVIVIMGTLISYLAGLHERWNVKIVGFIPIGIPAPVMPNLSRADTFIIEGIVTGFTSFAISFAMVDILTRKYRYTVNQNMELIAYGLTYVVSSFFHCFAGAAAPPRCIVMDMSGGKTQVASFFTILLLVLVLLVIGPLFRYLPNSCLACIIIVALVPLYKQVTILPRLWRISKPDLTIWIVTFLVSVVIDVSVSLGAGIAIAILVSVLPALSAKGYSYGMAGHRDLHAPIETHSKVKLQNDIAVFRYESTLSYLTIKNFKQQLFQVTVDPDVANPHNDSMIKGYLKPSMHTLIEMNAQVESNGEINDEHTMNGTANGEVKFDADGNKSKTRHCICASADLGPMMTNFRAVVLDCAPIGYIDLLGLDTLKDIHKEFRALGISFVLADCNPNLLKKLCVAGVMKEHGADGILAFPTVQDAVETYSGQFMERHLENGIIRIAIATGAVGIL